MKSIITLLLILTALLNFEVNAQPIKVLMVLSSNGLEQGDSQPGYEFDEFAKAYLTFKNNGFDIDITSPRGGLIEADKYDPSKRYNQSILNDDVAMEKLNNSIPSAKLSPSKYQAVFVVGGKGAMFDLPYDKPLQKVISTIYENQGIIAAVCHGPAALVNITLSNGDHLVNGKRVNAFTNKEERAFGKKWINTFDFLLEDELKQKGGIFESSPMMLSHVTIDGRLITGQNPFSTQPTAEAVVNALGVIPKSTEPHIEDRTISLISRLLNKDKDAYVEYEKARDLFQTPLIGMYGYYLLKHSENKQETQSAVDLIQLASKSMAHPQLQVALAQGLIKLKKITDATEVVEKLLKQHPDNQQAIALLSELQQS
jgi:putative intracellular protease/amidase